jgi:ribonuclease P/MRP protein subunit RPP40
MFDFCKAFDKAPHKCVVEAAASLGIRGTALKWISSFLTGRTQQVRVGESLSATSDVISGVIQGSVLGPVLFIMLTNSLLNSIKLPLGGFADDLKLGANVAVYSRRKYSMK